jgi:phosphatidylglycerophosphatase A
VNKVLLWIAQGFGVGRIPVAPGTFGSLVGLLWFVLLLQLKSFGVFLAGGIIGLALSIWLCGAAEQLLNRKDPGSVVLDEIAAVPLCFVGWIVLEMRHSVSLPAAGYFFSASTWLPTLGVFVAFRLFDVLKPWPVRQSQSFPRGWGITVDDVLAAVYVNVVVLAVFAGTRLLNH